MSIIYDALKKSQKARSARAPSVVSITRHLNRKKMIMVLVIGVALFATTATLLLTGPSTSASILSQNTVKTLPVPVIASAPRLMLEGVFLSENERLAMINHHTYHEGDRVNGMQVMSIAFDQVTLQNKSRSLTLRSALTQLD